jgi:ubiquinone/menaquinone biosynthesis C-methylase UbiE
MTRWDQILPEKNYSPEEPDEPVVNLLKSLKKKKDTRALDLACGTGRHVVYLAEQGIDTNGADTSKTGLELTRKRLRKRRLSAALVKCDMSFLPYRGLCFDVVICTRAIYHQKREGIQATLSEISRILREHGLLLVDFLSKRTYSHGKGTEVEKNTFVETEGHERGVLHHFVDRQEIKVLLSGFKIVDVELKEQKIDGKLRSRWIVTIVA